MKVIIAGGRNFGSVELVSEAVALSGFAVTEVVSGGARGVDSAGEEWAAFAGIPVKRFPADWGKHGRAAGPIRNGEMAAYADALVAIWDGQSRGTADMIHAAKLKGLKVYVMRVEP